MFGRLKHFLSLIVLLICVYSFGQREFLVTVNSNTGSFSIVDSLPGVHWIYTMPRYSIFDQLNHRYIFRGQDANYTDYLYSVDASSGDIISNPLFPSFSDPSDNIIELQFDSQLNKLFGLHWNNSEEREYFVSIDPVSGQYTIIDSIPDAHWIISGSTSYDHVNHRYFFRSQNDDGSFHNLVIDSNNGNVISDSDYIGLTGPNNNISFPCYDYTLGKMYGLYWNDSTQKEYLVLIDPYNGYFEVISEIPGVRWLMSSPNYHTYDSNNHRFFFLGLDSNMNQHLYSINTQTGQVIASPSFPVLSDPNDNVIELVYDNSTNQLFALHWDNYTGQLDIPENNNSVQMIVYPNPFTENCTIKLNKEYTQVSVTVFDSSGKIVRTKNELNLSEMHFQREGLTDGIYFISVIADNVQLGIVKMVVE